MSSVKAIDLNDSELAVIIDSLDMAREKIWADAPGGTSTENIDSALNKINSGMTPATTRAVLIFQED